MKLSVSAVEEVGKYASKIPGKKLVIFISPGWPSLSGPNVHLSTKDEQIIFKTIVSLSTLMRESGITLYSVDPNGATRAGPLRAFDYLRFLKGVRSPSEAVLGDLSLDVLASQSGGRVLNSRNDLGTEIAACVRDSDSYYALTIDGASSGGSLDYHQIDVKISRPKVKAQTRAGYYSGSLP